MANSLQAKKRIRQNTTHRLRNMSTKSELKTLTKKLLGYVAAKDKEAAQPLFLALISKMDKAGSRNVYHRNTIAHKKSQLTKAYNELAGS